MKFIKRTIILSFLIILQIYICNVTFFPDSVILMQGEELNLKTAFGLTLCDNSSMQTASNINKKKISDSGTIDVSLNLFGKIPLKETKVNVVERTAVIPMGKAIGMKLYTDGVLVVGMSEINGKKPYENTGIQEGDRIIKINNEKINDSDELIETVNKSGGKKLEVTYKRDDKTITTSISPVKVDDNSYKIGLWIRDSAAGVGTMTFYEPSSKMFAALGHGITDIDTSDIITIASGQLVTTNIMSIVKGEKGNPGEIRGSIDKGDTIGTISKNTRFGIYGDISKLSSLNVSSSKQMQVALRNEIKAGKAQIMCELENGKTEKYDIEIQKVFYNNNENNKSMFIKITDNRLLEQTGGIIQGMSGAPIIQNDKFVGAVTHVLVNDPTAGYGVFADIMIQQLRK